MFESVIPAASLAAGGLAGGVGWLVLRKREAKARHKKEWGLVILGTAGMLAGGLPLLASGTPLTVTHPWNRTMLCYLTGVSLLTAGLFTFLPRKMRNGVFSLLIGLSVVFQIHAVRDYEKEWELAGDLFTQLVEAAPYIKKGTLVLYDELPFIYYSANNLNAFLNWTYDPDRGVGDEEYKLFEIDERLGEELPALETDLRVEHGTFEGNTSQVLVIALDGDGDLVILNKDKPCMGELPGITRQAEHLSVPDEVIIDDGVSAVLPPIFQ